MTDMPLPRRPSIGWRSRWLNASCLITAVMASMTSLSEIEPWPAIRALVSLSSSPPRPMSRWATAWRNRSYSSWLRAFNSASFCTPSLSSSFGLRPQPIGLRVVERTHVRFGDRRDGPQNALLAAAGARAVARHQRVVVPAHHQHVAQRGGLRVLRARVVVEAQVLLRRVGQQVQERGAGLVLRVDVLGFLHHLQRLVVAAGRDAGRAALAEVRHEDREDAAAAGRSSSPGVAKIAFAF